MRYNPGPIDDAFMEPFIVVLPTEIKTPAGTALGGI